MDEFNRYALRCQWYSTDVPCDGPLTVDAKFIIRLHCGAASAEEIAEAQKRIALTLCSGPIDVVKATDKPRSFYCGQLNDVDRNTCTQCGGSL